MFFGRLRRRVALLAGSLHWWSRSRSWLLRASRREVRRFERDGAGNPTSRDASAWPFATTSPWNHPIGPGAQYSAAGDAQTQAVTTAPATINSAVWSKPIVLASLSDPVRYLGSGGNAIQIHVPDSATPAGPPGGDQHLNIVDPSRHVVDESWKTSRVFANNLASGFHIRVDLRGDGLTGATASGMSSTAGVIRTWELQARDIRHVLSICMPPDDMAVGPVWPARTQDSSAAAVYHGSVHMGALMAIPPSVSIPALGLSPKRRGHRHRAATLRRVRHRQGRGDGAVRRALGTEPGQFGTRRHAPDPGAAQSRDEQLAVQHRWGRELARAACAALLQLTPTTSKRSNRTHGRCRGRRSPGAAVPGLAGTRAEADCG